MVLSFPHCRKWRGIKVSAILPFFLVQILLLAFSVSGYAEDVASGEKLFKTNCTSCHNLPYSDVTLVGPGLKDVYKVESDEWLMKWIKNNAALRGSGDKDALAIYDKFGHAAMTTFVQFSDDDLKSVIAYIKDASVKGPPTTTTGVKPGPTTSTPESDSGSDGILWAVVVILLVLVILVTRINANLNRLVQEKTGQAVTEPRPLWTVLTDKRNIAAVALIIIIISGYEVVDYTQTLGRSKGYQPTQPIHFSHQIHAGQNQISCLYCHAGAEKSKTASIPSVNICMNCHKAIKEGPRTGTREIAKIYAAYDNNVPIKWVKIHNLPDYVYFNHSQHVAIGKLPCQKCHGPVETMDEVYQFSSLSMGWCVNCHRETGVQFTTNKYYDSVYQNLHKELKDGKISKVTEEMMGGTECQKCHY